MRKETIRIKGLFIIASLLVGCVTARLTEHNPEKEWLYKGDLHKAISRATGLRVRNSGTSSLSERPGKTLIACTDSTELSELLKHLRFKQVNPRWYCMCAGGPTLEWYVGTNLVAEASLHHGERMRWPGHWDGDANLTSESSGWLVDWLDKRGVSEPKKEYESSKKAASQSDDGTW